MSLVLLTEWYLDSSPERQMELRTALEINCRNPYVSTVYLFGTPDDLMAAPAFAKIVPTVTTTRMTFEKFFAFAADVLEGKLCAIANADCYFDETLVLIDDIDFEGRALCLTRWDVTPESLHFVGNPGSQDAWIFRGGVRVAADFFLGVAACDKKIAWILKHEAGLKLANPSLSLRVCHLHLSQKRNYDPRKRLPPPHLAVVPTLLVGSQPEELLIGR